MAQTANYGFEKPSTDKNVDEEFYQLQETLDLLDSILSALQTAVNGKSATGHTHAIADVLDLAAQLAAKMPASTTFKLDDLTDVSGADGAPDNYVLVKSALGWIPSSALAALGTHGHLISEITGLVDALAGKSAVGHVHAIADTTGLATALDNRLRFDAAQTKTQAERGQARANIGGGVLAGFRNKIINGDFDFWQRSTSQTSNGYGSDDRWSNEQAGSTKTHSRQAFTLGQTDVPGNPAFFSRTVVVSAAGSASFVFKRQKVESVRHLAGRRATLTFHAKADTSKSMAVEVLQRFGSGGSPSADVRVDTRKLALTSSWQKFSYAIDLPSVSGKTLGSNGDDFLQLAFWFDAGSNFNAATDSLGQQSGTFDIAHVSLVEGDATAEEDPFTPRHPQQELALCQRYYENCGQIRGSQSASGANGFVNWLFKVTKRATPTFVAGAGSTLTASFARVDGVELQQITGSVPSFSGTSTADAEL